MESVELMSSMPGVTLMQGDCVKVMREMPEASVDAVVTDPPYGLEFMGKDWDAPHKARIRERIDGRTNPRNGKSTTRTPESYTAGVAYQDWCTEWARECLRVLKPGGFLLASGGTRTVHRLTCAIEDAGFEIRDSITWLYGSGFPKSLDVSKAIDKMAGAEREVIGRYEHPDGNPRKAIAGRHPNVYQHANGVEGWHTPITAPTTEAAKQWEGFGTALKPAHEPVVVARKPFSEKTIAANVLEHGTGALNIDASRISGKPRTTHKDGNYSSANVRPNTAFNMGDQHKCEEPSGRWPANVILSHSPECQRVGVKRVPGHKGYANGPGGSSCQFSQKGTETTRTEAWAGYADPDGFETTEAWECARDEAGNYLCPVALLDEQSGASKGGQGGIRYRPASSDLGVMNDDGWQPKPVAQPSYADQGGASRYFKTFEGEPGFFYCAKSSRSERNSFTKSLPRTKNKRKRYQQDRSGRWFKRVSNTHPTVKPRKLLSYLVKLVTPPGGVVLDPFAGSGSTLVAAIQEGFEAVGIEQDASYIEIAERRVAHARAEIESQPLALEV